MSKTTNSFIMNPSEGEKYLEKMCQNANKHGIQIMYVVARFCSPSVFTGVHTKYGSKYPEALGHAIRNEIGQYDLEQYIFDGHTVYVIPDDNSEDFDEEF